MLDIRVNLKHLFYQKNLFQWFFYCYFKTKLQKIWRVHFFPTTEGFDRIDTQLPKNELFESGIKRIKQELVMSKIT